MKNKKKILLKIFTILTILNIINGLKFITMFAQNNEKNGIVQYIYNQKEFTNNEEVVLTINLTDVVKVSEIDLRIKINPSVLQPLTENNRYFRFTALSIFENEDIINSYTDDTLWLKLTKTHNINDDYLIGSKNNVTIIKFTSLTKIKNIEEYINDEQIMIDLFDANRNKINITTNYSEKIAYNWTLNSNSVMVNSNPLELNDYLTITNRIQNEYKLSITNNINYQKIGLYEIKIAIYDLINNDIISEVVRISVVDLDAPECILSPENDTIEIEDTKLKDLNLNDYFTFTDNYDQFVNVSFEYYTLDDEKISSLEQLINYLGTIQTAKFNVFAADSSGNISEKYEYKIQIKDTTPPILRIDDQIEITVNDKLNLNQYIDISDNYDPNPSYAISYYYEDGTECFEVENAIKNGKNLFIKIVGFDNKNNYTNEKKINLIVIDNVSPEIIIKSNELEDRFIKNFDYLNHFEFNDNVSKNLKITFIFGLDVLVDNSLNDDNINKKFKELLNENLTITFSIQVKDESGNASLLENCKFNVIDTTSPEIIIKNIENGKTYSSIETIDYEIIDNYSKDIKTEIIINDLPYNGYLELKNGLNTISITATDEFENTKTIILQFTIDQEKDEQKTNTNILKNDFSYEMIFLVIILFLSFIIVIYRAFLIQHQSKRKIQK